MTDPRDPDGLVTAWAKPERKKPRDPMHEANKKSQAALLGVPEAPPLARVGAPMTMAGLREIPEPDERWLVERWLPEDCNNLWAGYPKTYKTLLVEELAVSLVTATPFLDRFEVKEPRRVGLVLMEDAKHRTRRRLERIAEGRGLTLWDLDGLFFWFRPMLRLASLTDVEELAHHVEDRELDYLHIDSWSYVASGNSNDADDVTPQLQNLSRLRERFPGLSVGLTHHARKSSQDKGGDRLTDHIRNSSAFGAWYDVGVVLSRADEASPVKVRSEMRDLPAPDPFVFNVEDQYPAGPSAGTYPSGWLRLTASDRSPALVERESAALRFVAGVREFLDSHDGCSKEQLKRGITGDNALILVAFDLLCEQGKARYVEPERRGMAGRCELTPLTPAVTPLAEGSRTNPADPAVTPVGGTGAEGVPWVEETSAKDQRGPDASCLNDECSNEVGRRGVPCPGCYRDGWREGQDPPQERAA